jgi:hypothetical protein
LIENLNETRVSNVVKENINLQNDHRNSVALIDQIINDCKMLISEERLSKEVKNKRFKQQTSSKMQNNKDFPITHDSILADKLLYLSKLVDSLKTRMSIIEDENNFLRSEYSKVSQASMQMNKT